MAPGGAAEGTENVVPVRHFLGDGLGVNMKSEHGVEGHSQDFGFIFEKEENVVDKDLWV